MHFKVFFLFLFYVLNLIFICFTCFALFACLIFYFVCFVHLCGLLLLDLASIFLSIPPSPSFLMNDSDVFLPEASGKMRVVL